MNSEITPTVSKSAAKVRVLVLDAVADADPPVSQAAMFSTRCVGGHGAVREVCELILDAQGNLHDALAPWLGEK